MDELYGDVILKENEIKIFEFENQGIEIAYLNGEPLFNPYDIAKCLDIKKDSVDRYLRRMDDTEVFDMAQIDPNLKMDFKSKEDLRFWAREPGMYVLIFNSRKDTAKRFVKWITHDVLPSIRETGTYSINNQEQMLQTVIKNTEILLGVRRREIAIFQNESPNKKLSNLMVDCSRQGMGHMRDLYNELYYIFESETGINLLEIAELKGMRIRDYLKKNQTVAQTLYEFAYNHFKEDTRQVILIPLDKNQKSLDLFIKGGVD